MKKYFTRSEPIDTTILLITKHFVLRYFIRLHILNVTDTKLMFTHDMS